MQWYLAKIVFQIICGRGAHTPQFDEQLRIIQGCNEEEAFHKATSIGNMEQDVFYNREQQLVQWKFINISELYAIAFMDGAEVASKIDEVDNAAAHINFIHFKAGQIQSKSLQKAG